MDPIKIIQKYYDKDSDLYRILLDHSQAVSKKALEIAENLDNKEIDLKFIEEAALLHDIGIYLTHSPGIGCHGKDNYLCHGILGREILEKEGLPKHAMVCERHIGVGITKEEVKDGNLPLPARDMLPVSLEEKIICLADLFFSKDSAKGERSVEEIKRFWSDFGPGQKRRIESLIDELLVE